MFRIGDAKVIIRIVRLENDIRGYGGADGKDGSGAVGSLSLANVGDRGHGRREE